MDRRSLAALAAAQGGSPMDTFAEDFQSGMKAGASLTKLAEDSMIRERMGKMAESVKDGGDLTNIDESLYADPIGMRALGRFQEHYISTREGMQKSAQLNRELAAQAAQEYSAAMQALERNRDNPEVFAAIATHLSKKLPFPYQARASDRPGVMNLYFQDVDGLKPTGRSLTYDEVIGALKSAATSDKKLMNQIGMYLLANITHNMQIKQDPTKWLYAENGQQLVPQMQMHDGVFEVGYIPVGSNEFITQEEAKRQYGKLFNFSQYRDNRKMGQEDRQLDISQQNANTSLAGAALNREKFVYDKQMDADKFAYQKEKDDRQAQFEKRRLDISEQGMNTSLASVGVSQQNADTSRKRLEWEMSGGTQKELTPAQLRQVEKDYTDTIMSDQGYVYKNRAYVKEETDESGWITKRTTAPASLVNQARAEARAQVVQDYGRAASIQAVKNDVSSPHLSDSAASTCDPLNLFGEQRHSSKK